MSWLSFEIQSAVTALQVPAIIEDWKQSQVMDLRFEENP